MADDILTETFWSLADTVAWVATRKVDALAYVRAAKDPDVAFYVWRALQGDDQPFLRDLDAGWEILAAAMCDGLTSFATRRQKYRLGGAESFAPGVVFPPVDAPGSPLDYRLEYHQGQMALVPNDRPLHHFWFEWTDFRFKRDKVMATFPASGAIQEFKLYESNNQSEPPATSVIPKRRNRRSQDQDRVRPFLESLYRGGIPDQSILKDADLYKAVANAMGADLGKTVVPSRETVLRAAGRMALRKK